ncbi:hypothetical protein UM396_17025 [Geobacillus subterraneus]|uniref:hypothetical protein n=1 Tax=Geobacillus subterraneus TaxID=129338 RepID=UPI002AC9C3C4|nr:hypothetical protein [Geobacillus subterraneus]WPZ18229.1 hypothetical protein UM396_17025 [Geobacillus subterraneus]
MAVKDTDGGSWFCLRPSGTEPKAKLYFGVKGASLAESERLVTELEQSVMDKVAQIIEKARGC